MINFKVKPFSELTSDELYELLRLRSDVFVVEQNCAFLDLDNKDQLALHVIGKKNNQIVAYARLFKQGDCYNETSIGRVVVKKEERKFGYGHNLIQFSINIIQKKFNTSIIKIGAQAYLKKFYESHGFKQVSEEYIEDGISHIYMLANIRKKTE